MPRLLPLFLAASLLASAAWAPAVAANTCTVKLKEKTLATGTNPQAIVTGDFNRDGKLDFAVVDYNGGAAGSVSVFLGNGDGTFQKKVDYAVGNGPDALAVADVNGDGVLDLVTGNDTGNSVSVLLGNGDGTFKAKKDYGVGAYPHGVALADFNGDGFPDIVETNEGNANVGVLLNNGDGTFGAVKTYSTPGEPYWVTTGDFNKDGKIDLAVTGYGGTVGILLGRGNGTFKPVQLYATGAAPAVVLAYDFNGDGNLDLATADYNSGQAGYVSILLGNGDGTFAAHTDYAAGTGPDGLAVGKITGDKHADLAVADLIGGTMSILPGNGDGTFGTAQSFSTDQYPLGVGVGAFHGQKKTKDDIVVSNDLSSDANFFKNKGCR